MPRTEERRGLLNKLEEDQRNPYRNLCFYDLFKHVEYSSSINRSLHLIYKIYLMSTSSQMNKQFGSKSARKESICTCIIVWCQCHIGMFKGDTVSVYVDVERRCTKGLAKIFTGSKFFVGNGIAEVGRDDVFCAKEILRWSNNCFIKFCLYKALFGLWFCRSNANHLFIFCPHLFPSIMQLN